ncbi:MAG: peptidylprolyl isomerase [Nonlabens ulvanivorans]|uniref:peptidylprolyl isomerase n=4 Tax=Nonlabens ulvanivorans TaxID=906888 RepID=UPI003263370B
MMLSRVRNFKLSHKYLLVILGLAFAKASIAQTDTIQMSDEQVKEEVLLAMRKIDSVKPVPVVQVRELIDGVSGVVGDYVILNSDIKKQLLEIQGDQDLGELSDCQLIESILREKMFAHHAVQDSITVSDQEVEAETDQRIAYFKGILGSEDAVLKKYQKSSMPELRSALNRITRDMKLAQRMQQRITEEVEITPEEVRAFFFNLPEEERPLFNTEVEIAQIVVKPKPSDDAVKDVVDKLNDYRTDVLENGASFAAKAALFSEDVATERQGGIISLKRGDQFVKEFKEAAFSLTEGEVSEPFETVFGWHILKVEKVKGQVRDVRHILLYPYISVAQVNEAKQKLDEMRDRIILQEITFDQAAREISDEKETAKNGGKLINPNTGEARLDLTRLSEDLTRQIIFLEKGDISGIIDEKDQIGRETFKIIYVINKIKDHKADYALDYLKIKDIALRDKQVKAIRKWQSEKLKDTYIKIGAEFKGCDFENEWNK